VVTPSALIADTAPPCMFATALTIARPNPWPRCVPWSWQRRVDAVEAVEQPRKMRLSDRAHRERGDKKLLHECLRRTLVRSERGFLWRGARRARCFAGGCSTQRFSTFVTASSPDAGRRRPVAC
jgi:hypothetical protein